MDHNLGFFIGDEKGGMALILFQLLTTQQGFHHLWGGGA